MVEQARFEFHQDLKNETEEAQLRKHAGAFGMGANMPMLRRLDVF